MGDAKCPCSEAKSRVKCPKNGKYASPKILTGRNGRRYEQHSSTLEGPKSRTDARDLRLKTALRQRITYEICGQHRLVRRRTAANHGLLSALVLEIGSVQHIKLVPVAYMRPGRHLSFAKRARIRYNFHHQEWKVDLGVPVSGGIGASIRHTRHVR